MVGSIAGAIRPEPAPLSARLEEAINHLSLGIVVFNEKREVVFCNKRYAEMYGLSPEQVKPGTPTSELIRHRLNLGLKVSVAHDDYVRSRVGQDVALDTTVQEFTDGRIIAYTVHPMPGGGGMATHEDITEREELNARLKTQYELGREQEEALRIRNFQFDTAINNMSQGLCFFDSDHRLIVANDRFVEMYDIPPDRVGPGTTLAEIVDLRFEAGSFPAMSRDEYLHWRTNVAVSNEAKDSIVELKNGRTFKIRHRPMPGGGWVATHEDITEQRQSEVKIEHMAHHDALTDLANRVLLNERLERDAWPPSEMVAVHHLDLDQFKAVNDTFGHHAGDKLLKIVAERLSRAGSRDRHDRAHGRRRVRHRAGPDRGSRRRHLAGAARDQAVERALRHRRPPGRDRRQHRHLGRPRRRHQPRQTAAQRRPRALPRQGRRPRHVPLLRAGDGFADADPPRHGAGSAQGAAGRRVRAALPAGRQSREQARSAASRR